MELAPGLNHFRAHANVTAVGAIDLAGTISAPGLGEARFESAVTLRRPRVLLLSQGSRRHRDAPAAHARANQFDIEQVGWRSRRSSTPTN